MLGVGLESWDRGFTAGRGLIPGRPYVPRALPGVTPEHRHRVAAVYLPRSPDQHLTLLFQGPQVVCSPEPALTAQPLHMLPGNLNVE